MKLFILVFLTIVHISFFSQAQIINPARFLPQNNNQNNNESFLLGLPNNDMIMFWFDSTNNQIKSAKSFDGGNYWSNESIVATVTPTIHNIDINAVVLNSGRILLTYRLLVYYYRYSDDNGNTWSTQTTLPTRSSLAQRFRIFLSSLSKLSNGQIVFTHSFSNSPTFQNPKGIFSIKSSDGINWTTADTIDLDGKNGYIINTNNSKDILVYQDSTETGKDLFYRNSTNAGLSWSPRNLLVNGTIDPTEPKGAMDQNGKIWVYYFESTVTPFQSIY